MCVCVCVCVLVCAHTALYSVFSAAMGPQYGYKLEMCAYLDPLPADPLAAFANWTITHYGAAYSSSCYYSTACLSNASRIDEWFNVKPWIWQCCSGAYNAALIYRRSLAFIAHNVFVFIKRMAFSRSCVLASRLPWLVTVQCHRPRLLRSSVPRLEMRRSLTSR